MRNNPVVIATNPNHLVIYIEDGKATVCIDGGVWIYPAELVIRQTFKDPKKKEE
jgi:hypothetical protein